MSSTPVRQTFTREGAGGRAAHDVGGLDFGPIDRHEHDLALWEKRTDAMLILLASKKGVFKIDAMRRAIEDYGQQDYDRTTYYEKWIRAIRNLVVEQEVLSADEIDSRMREVAEHHRKAGREVAADGIEWPAGDKP
ncbi:MAG: nitrile hydratase subunit beta [Proteobacteria bacterium]|nr:nitrile hydratase subunit beta [Pseudomonadota bacterium]